MDGCMLLLAVVVVCICALACLRSDTRRNATPEVQRLAAYGSAVVPQSPVRPSEKSPRNKEEVAPASAAPSSTGFDDPSLWADSSAGKRRLGDLMPASWRGGSAHAAGGEGDEAFRRLSITPEQVSQSQRAMGLVRLPQSTRAGLARSVGQSSLIREAVTPLSAVPVGKNAFFSHDSELRLSAISAATGEYPTNLCC
jgi:hypothetical protein